MTSAVHNPLGWLLKVFPNRDSKLASDNSCVGPWDKISVTRIVSGKRVCKFYVLVGGAAFSNLPHTVLNGHRSFNTPGQINAQSSADAIKRIWEVNYFRFEFRRNNLTWLLVSNCFIHLLPIFLHKNFLFFLEQWTVGPLRRRGIRESIRKMSNWLLCLRMQVSNEAH